MTTYVLRVLYSDGRPPEDLGTFATQQEALAYAANAAFDDSLLDASNWGDHEEVEGGLHWLSPADGTQLEVLPLTNA